MTETRVSVEPIPYSPAFAPHVKGRYSPRVYDPELGEHEPQKVWAHCDACGEDYGPIECKSGRVRQHVDTWAATGHLHRDRLDPRPVVKPAGS